MMLEPGAARSTLTTPKLLKPDRLSDWFDEATEMMLGSGKLAG